MRHAHSDGAAAAWSGARVTVSASGTLVPNRGSTIWSGLRAGALARHTSTATKATRGLPADMPHAEGRLGVALAGLPLGIVAAPFSAPVAARPACAGPRPSSEEGSGAAGVGPEEGQVGPAVASPGQGGLSAGLAVREVRPPDRLRSAPEPPVGAIGGPHRAAVPGRSPDRPVEPAADALRLQRGSPPLPAAAQGTLIPGCPACRSLTTPSPRPATRSGPLIRRCL